MLVSVIIPVYNRCETIKKSVLSVLNQSYSNLELIVVDDHSTDNTLQELESINDKRMSIIRLDSNHGACYARNVGIENSIGDFIAFQDSDDYWHENKLEIQLNAIKVYNADICICQMNRHGFNTDNGVYPKMSDGIINYRDLIGNFMVSTQTIIAKKIIFLNYKFDENVKRMQDYDWIVRAGEKYKVCGVKKPLVDVFLQNNSITSYDYDKLIDSYRFFIIKYKYLSNKFPEIKLLMDKCLAYAMTMNGEQSCRLYMNLFLRTFDFKFFAKSVLARMNILKTIYNYKYK